MTREDIIKLALEAGIRQAAALRVWGRDGLTDTEQSDFEAVIRFAALVAAAELEECAKMFDGEHDTYIAAAIRARIKP